MKFSYCIIPQGTARDVGDLVESAERWGADMVWIPDEAFMRDPYVLLASAATRARRIALGVGIANPYTRHPMQLARAIGTLTDLREGGMVFGIGAGLKSTRQAIGAAEGDFVETTRDCILVMKRLFAGERVTFANPVFRLEGARLEFVPRTAVPVYVASTHRAAFEMAGEIAEGVIVGNVAEPEAMRAVVGWIHDGARRAGRDPAALDVVAWTIVVATDEPAAAYDGMREMIARSIAIAHREVRALLGIAPERWKAVHAAVRHGVGVIDRDLVPNALIDKLAIVGPLAQCRDRLRALEAAGAHRLGARATLGLMRQYDWEANMRSIAAALQGDAPMRREQRGAPRHG